MVLKGVSCEVDGEKVALGAHIGHVPEHDITLTHCELVPAEHYAIDTWK